MSTTPQLDPHDPVPPAGPNPIVTALRPILKPLASLQLTVTLLALGVILVFFGTLAQKTAGMWTVVDKYFWSWIVMIDLQPTMEFCKIFLGMDKDAEAPSGVVIPFPGGKLIGWAMFLNLLAAHTLRFQLTWKRTGIWLAHGGLLLLLIGEYITREYQVEQRMTIWEGEAINFTEDPRRYELAFTSPEPGKDTALVTVIPDHMLQTAVKTGERITHETLPVDVQVDQYMTNSSMYEPRHIEARKEQGKQVPENPATHGLGRQDIVEPKEEVSGVNANEEDMPSAYVTLYKKGTDEKLGTYLASLWYTGNSLTRKSDPKQWVKLDDGSEHLLALRRIRYYKDYSFYLHDVRFDKYTGTSTPKNYSSDLTLVDPERGQSRDVHIEMNDPLHTHGETFYQSQFHSGLNSSKEATVLQVVRNPGEILPYVACGLVSAGLLFHFFLGLSGYLTRQRKATVMAGLSNEPRGIFQRALPWLMVLFGVMILARGAMPPPAKNQHLTDAARLPVVDGGRVKPLDTAARVYLRKISAREEWQDEYGVKRPAIEWLLDVMALYNHPNPKQAVALDHKVIRIENDQVLSLLGLKRREGYRFSFAEVAPKLQNLSMAARKARMTLDGDDPSSDEKTGNQEVDRFFESEDRDVFAKQVLEVNERIETYFNLLLGAAPSVRVLPPTESRDWYWVEDFRKEARNDILRQQGIDPKQWDLFRGDFQQQVMARAEEPARQALLADPQAAKFLEVLDAWRANEKDEFRDRLAKFREETGGTIDPGDIRRVEFEVFLNRFAPAFWVIGLYVMAGMLTLAGWVALAFQPSLGEAFRRSAFWVLVTAFLVHGFALFARMYLMERPLVFVTNLYSTAVFIGWAAVGLGLFIERIVPIGLGNIGAAVVGGGTAIIAHNLAASGDTLEMMQAVLDTNFWLATHVTTINLGYAATYFAGVVGIVYIWFGLFTPILSKRIQVNASGAGGQTVGRVLGQVMYGVVCLATLLSFIGTVLGGIWADYSWGRFWGWDPKENGAVLIVLWNALILHARWCGLVKDRGVAVLTLVGNMITTWSYFGTNQLGVGLHAYGFNDDLAKGCTITWLGHLVLIGMGLIPLRFWRSYAQAGQPQSTQTATTPVSTDAPHMVAPAPTATTTPEPAPHPPTASTNGEVAKPQTKPSPGKGKKPKKRR